MVLIYVVIDTYIFVMQLDEHFSRPMKEFISSCLKKNPAEVGFTFLYCLNKKQLTALKVKRS